MFWGGWIDEEGEGVFDWIIIEENLDEDSLFDYWRSVIDC